MLQHFCVRFLNKKYKVERYFLYYMQIQKSAIWHNAHLNLFHLLLTQNIKFPNKICLQFGKINIVE